MENRYSQGLPLRQPYPHGRPSRVSVDGGDGRWSHDPSPSYINDEESLRHNSLSQRGRPGRRSSELVSLEDSVVQLSQCVIAAMATFNKIEVDFDQDIHRIRRYCDKGLIEEIWMQKVRPRNRSRNHRHGQPGEAEDLDRNERQSPGLRETMKQLYPALGAALSAAENFRPSQRKPTPYSSEDVRNIHKRLNKANKDFGDHWRSILESHSEFGRMRTTLDELRTFLSHNGGEFGRNQGDSVRFDDRSSRGAHAESDAQGRAGYGEDDEHMEEYSGGQNNGEGKPTQSIQVDGKTSDNVDIIKRSTQLLAWTCPVERKEAEGPTRE
ncbi:MAG: hypothetical protein Q9202_003949 [Teloschistes flavicans]